MTQNDQAINSKLILNICEPLVVILTEKIAFSQKYRVVTEVSKSRFDSLFLGGADLQALAIVRVPFF